MRFAHTTIQARDIEKSIAFYRAVAGLEVIRRFPAGPGEIAFLANGAGETCVELVSIPGDRKFEGTGISIGFEIDDAERELKTAQERGLSPSEMHSPSPSAKYFFVADPDGVSVQIIQENVEQQ